MILFYIIFLSDYFFILISSGYEFIEPRLWDLVFKISFRRQRKKKFQNFYFILLNQKTRVERFWWIIYVCAVATACNSKPNDFYLSLNFFYKNEIKISLCFRFLWSFFYIMFESCIQLYGKSIRFYEEHLYCRFSIALSVWPQSSRLTIRAVILHWYRYFDSNYRKSIKSSLEKAFHIFLCVQAL